MSLIEKFLKEKAEMHAKFDKAREACAKAMDDASGEFLETVKSLAKDASDEELIEFIFRSGDAVEDVDKIAMMVAAKEAKAEKSGGPEIVIINLD